MESLPRLVVEIPADDESDLDVDGEDDGEDEVL